MCNQELHKYKFVLQTLTETWENTNKICLNFVLKSINIIVWLIVVVEKYSEFILILFKINLIENFWYFIENKKYL